MPFATLAVGAPALAPASAQAAEQYAPDLPEPLVVAVLDKGEEREGRTTAVLLYGFQYQHPASGAHIDVPSGFVTDFASIPAIAQVVVEPFGRHAKAAVLHDWLYAVGEPGLKWFADQVFYDAMGELGVDDWRQKIMYQAVHNFGGHGYDAAKDDWPTSWANWKTGDRASPPRTRESGFQSMWAHPPRSDYMPW